MTLEKALVCCRACGTHLAQHEGAWDPYEKGSPEMNDYDPRNAWKDTRLLPFVVFYCPNGCDDDEELRRLLSGNLYTVPRTELQVRRVNLQRGHDWEWRLATNPLRKRARK
jgi:hypothetical protein